MNTKKELFGIEIKKYLKATKEEKSKILDSLERQTKMHRKAIIRRFKREQMRKAGDTKKSGRKLYYTPDTTAALKDIWTACDEMCGELIHPVINEYISIFERDKHWNHSDEATAKLRAMSEGTVKDRVGRFMKEKGCSKGKSTTNPSSIKESIPVFCGPWMDVSVGHGQIDTVVHCGSTLAGDMLYSLSYTDVASGWWQGRAQWNKGMEVTKNSLSHIKDNLLIPWFHAHPDCGSEFLNNMVIIWINEVDMKFTRSRSYHKNDNAYVEQKNGHIIRKTVGYRRYDSKEVIETMNEYYDTLALHRNHFVPQQKLVSKERNGAKYRKKHDKAKTPYMRVLADPTVSKRIKDNLKLIHGKLNPLDLKKKLDKLKMKFNKIQTESGNLIR
ncbi:MAG: hypothetical protein ACE5F2_02840 [Candidatus Paceibacteria bacterium]